MGYLARGMVSKSEDALLGLPSNLGLRPKHVRLTQRPFHADQLRLPLNGSATVISTSALFSGLLQVVAAFSLREGGRENRPDQPDS